MGKCTEGWNVFQSIFADVNVAQMDEALQDLNVCDVSEGANMISWVNQLIYS